MKNGINNYMQIKKIKLQKKYYLSNLMISIFLLTFATIDTILDKPIRNFINFYSEI